MNRKGFFTGALTLVFLQLGPMARISNATEAPENVLKKFNASSTFDEASRYLTGRLKAQLRRVNKEETRDKMVRDSQMKDYDVLALPVTGNHQTIIVTHVKFIDEKKSPLADFPIIYKFVNEDNHWKIEWRQSGSAILELFTQQFAPHQFDSQNSFQINGRVFNMESAFASYKEENKEKAWINIKFYPFKFQDRDIEFLKYNSGPAVEDKDKPTAIASSMKYSEIRLDILTDRKSQIIAFSLGWDYRDGDKQISKAISPPISSVGAKKFNVSGKLFTLVAEGTSRNSDGTSEQWNIRIVDLPLLKKGF